MGSDIVDDRYENVWLEAAHVDSHENIALEFVLEVTLGSDQSLERKVLKEY